MAEPDHDDIMAELRGEFGSDQEADSPQVESDLSVGRASSTTDQTGRAHGIESGGRLELSDAGPDVLASTNSPAQQVSTSGLLRDVASLAVTGRIDADKVVDYMGLLQTHLLKSKSQDDAGIYAQVNVSKFDFDDQVVFQGIAYLMHLQQQSTVDTCLFNAHKEDLLVCLGLWVLSEDGTTSQGRSMLQIWRSVFTNHQLLRECLELRHSQAAADALDRILESGGSDRIRDQVDIFQKKLKKHAKALSIKEPSTVENYPCEIYSKLSAARQSVVFPKYFDTRTSNGFDCPAQAGEGPYSLDKIPCAVLVDGKLLSGGGQSRPPLPGKGDVQLRLGLNSSLPALVLNFYDPQTEMSISPSMAEICIHVASQTDDTGRFELLLSKSGFDQLGGNLKGKPASSDVHVAVIECTMRTACNPRIQSIGKENRLHPDARAVRQGHKVDIVCVINKSSPHSALLWFQQLLRMIPPSPGLDGTSFWLYRRSMPQDEETSLRKSMLSRFEKHGMGPLRPIHLFQKESSKMILRDPSNTTVKIPERYVVTQASEYLTLLMIGNFRERDVAVAARDAQARIPHDASLVFNHRDDTTGLNWYDITVTIDFDFDPRYLPCENRQIRFQCLGIDCQWKGIVVASSDDPLRITIAAKETKAIRQSLETLAQQQHLESNFAFDQYNPDDRSRVLRCGVKLLPDVGQTTFLRQQRVLATLDDRPCDFQCFNIIRLFGEPGRGTQYEFSLLDQCRSEEYRSRYVGYHEVNSELLRDAFSADPQRLMAVIRSEMLAFLDEDQRNAVEASVSNMPEGFLIMHGPPGCGKSTCISAMVLVSILFGTSVTVSAKANDAVDDLLKKVRTFMDAYGLDVRLVRRLANSKEAQARNALWQAEAKDLSSSDVLRHAGLDELQHSGCLALQAWQLSREASEESPSELREYQKAILQMQEHNPDHAKIPIQDCACQCDGAFVNGHQRASGGLRAYALDVSRAAEQYLLDTCNAVFVTVDTLAGMLEDRYLGSQALFVDEVSQMTMAEVLSVFPLSSNYDRVVCVGDPNQIGPYPLSRTQSVTEAGLIFEESLFKSRLIRFLDGQEIYLKNDYRNTELMVKLLNSVAYADGDSPALVCKQPTVPQLFETQPEETDTPAVSPSIERLAQWNFAEKSVMLLDIGTNPIVEWRGAKSKQTMTLDTTASKRSRSSTIAIQGGARKARYDPTAGSAFVEVVQYFINTLGVKEKDITFASMYKCDAEQVASRLRDMGISVDVRTVDAAQGLENKFVWINIVKCDLDNAGFVAQLGRIVVALSRASVLVVVCCNLEELRDCTRRDKDKKMLSIKKLLEFVDREELIFTWDVDPPKTGTKRKHANFTGEDRLDRRAPPRLEHAGRGYMDRDDPNLPSDHDRHPRDVTHDRGWQNGRIDGTQGNRGGYQHHGRGGHQRRGNQHRGRGGYPQRGRGRGRGSR